jgi:mono/diheme cytochrome c family protein
VARGELREDSAFYEGKGPDGAFVAKSPVPADDALLERGHARYTIYCQPCHDPRGDGKGILFQRGKVPTANLNDAKFRAYPDGQIFDVITNGTGLMPSYRWPIPPHDRWAIIAWVRALQAKRLAATEAAGSDAAAPAGS